jgi:DNA-binding beta-propeller fold protein YncE
MLIVFDLDSHYVTTTIPIGGGPDSIAFDAALRRVYTAGKAGVMTVIQQSAPDSYKVLDSIELHYGAHTLVVDPVTNNVYVGYASLLTRSRVAVFSPRAVNRPATSALTVKRRLAANVDYMNQD